MKNGQPQSNEVLDVRPFADEISLHKTGQLFSTDRLKAMRLVLPAGKGLAEHQAPGEITVHCLEGRVAFTAAGKTQELPAGHLLFLTAGERHSVEAIEDSSLLVTIALPS
jgi:quercetin dioxygenase-like cupin family protein